MVRSPLPAPATLAAVLALTGAAAAWQAPHRVAPTKHFTPTEHTTQVQPGPDDADAERRRLMGSVRSWGYSLSSADVDTVAAAAHDLLVVDNAFAIGALFQPE